MFKRLFWLVTGAGFGFGSSFWIMRTVRATVDRYRPRRVRSDAGQALHQLGADVRHAVGEGRTAMHEREAELRALRAGPRRRAIGPARP